MNSLYKKSTIIYLTVTVSLIAFIGSAFHYRIDRNVLLDTDAVSNMNNQPPQGSPGAAEQQYLDNLALHSFRQEHETSLRAHVDSASKENTKKSRKKHSDKTRRKKRARKYSPTFYEPSLPNSATQGWSDLLSRVTRELASDTFDIEEMKVCTVAFRFRLSN